ncbi:MAG: sugar ABC transporter permease [Oscillospiraceae bacterium]|nr:sugar ABC transporter permease [Oscillospiraceae bacterium]
MAKKRRTVEYGRYGYIFIAPFFLVYLIFQFWPLIYTFILSFQDVYKDKYGVMVDNGYSFANFTSVLGLEGGNSYVMQYFGNTAIMWVCNFVPQILLSLLLAVWLTDTKYKLKGSGAYKILIYLPNIITAASVSYLFYSLFGLNGPITLLLKDWGVIGASYNFMDSTAATRGLISFINFWMWYGNTTLLLIAGVLGINPSLFEAADIDGANGFQKFLHVTLPMLKPIMLYVLVTSAIGGLQMYDIPAMFNVKAQGVVGMPDDTSTTMTMYIRRLTSSGSMGRAAAVSVILFIVTLIISLLFFFFMGDREKKPKKAKKGASA